jgi:hypothetical protein
MPIDADAMTDTQVAIISNGVPEWEVAYLQSAGLGTDYVDAFTVTHILADVAEAGDTNTSEILEYASDAHFERAVELIMVSPSPLELEP